MVTMSMLEASYSALCYLKEKLGRRTLSALTGARRLEEIETEFSFDSTEQEVIETEFSFDPDELEKIETELSFDAAKLEKKETDFSFDSEELEEMVW